MYRYYQIFFKVVFTFCLLILLSVYAMEYIWGMKPCELCLYERLPYILMLTTAYIGIFMTRLRKILSLLIVLFGLGGVALSFFHVSVENSWFNYDLGCTTSSIAATDSIELLKNKIMGKDLLPCDATQYEFIWVTLAGWNFIANTVIFIFSAIFTFALIRTAPYDKF